MRTALATLILLAAITGASARCPSLPDDADTHFIENSESLMVCMQRELAQQTDALAAQAAIKAQLDALEAQVRQQNQRLLAIQPVQPIVVLPPPAAAWSF